MGALFTNIGSLEKINSDLVMKNFFDTLNKSHGIKGTIIQKVYFVNTYLFSKVWYLGQCFDLEKKMLEKLLSKAMNFIYAGENERPIRSLNF